MAKKKAEPKKKATKKAATKKGAKKEAAPKPGKRGTSALLERIQAKQAKTSAALLSGGAASEIKVVVPTGIDVLDNHVLGIGGWPCGRIAEIFGGEGSGKSSLVFSSIAQAQKIGLPVIFVETEHAITKGRIFEFGVDLDNVILCQPDHIEEVMEFIEDSLASMNVDEPCLLAWDSIAETPSKREFDGGVAKKDMPGERAKSLSKLIRTTKSRLSRLQVATLLVNQIRDKPGVMMGPTWTTPGGHGVKFGASIRLAFWGGEAQKQTVDGVEVHVGKKPILRTMKNKFAPPFREARVRFDYEGGWNNLWTTIKYAKDQDLIASGCRVTEKNYAEAKEALGWK